MRKPKKYHYIYKTTNLIRDYFYIGMHSTDNLEDGYLGSGKRLRYSINKYGKENHKFEILEFLPSREELKIREREIVNEELLVNPQCINLRIGGEGGGGFLNKEHQLKATLAGIKTQKEKKIGIYGMSPNKRFIISIKAAKTNKQNCTGCAHNPEIRKEMIERATSPAAKTKRIETLKRIEHQQGEKNSQYGKMWIYNLETHESIRIQKDDIIPDGWNKGRKINDNRI